MEVFDASLLIINCVRTLCKLSNVLLLFRTLFLSNYLSSCSIVHEEDFSRVILQLYSNRAKCPRVLTT